MRKKYLLFILLLLVISIPLVILLRAKYIKTTHRSAFGTFHTPLPLTENYTTEDTSTAPSVATGAIQGTMQRLARESKNQEWQQFVLTNARTGTKRILYELPENQITFEKLTAQNWSPTNRFFYVLYDLPNGTKNFLIFETDGRFANTQYYIAPFILPAQQTVAKIWWGDAETLDFTVKNGMDNTITSFIVDLNDSKGQLEQTNH